MRFVRLPRPLHYLTQNVDLLRDYGSGHRHTVYPETIQLQRGGFYKLRPANKADRLCQLWQSSSNLFVNDVCVCMCQCQTAVRALNIPCQKVAMSVYEWKYPIVKCRLYCR